MIPDNGVVIAVNTTSQHLLNRHEGWFNNPGCNNEDISCRGLWWINPGSGVDSAGDPDSTACRLMP
jgi:hypothetical protein